MYMKQFRYYSRWYFRSGKKYTYLGCFCIWTEFTQFSKRFNHNKGTKDRADFECYKKKQDDADMSNDKKLYTYH